MQRPTGVVFEGIRENEPLRLHDLLIYASLSLYDPGVVTRGNLSAALPRVRETSLGVDGMTVHELGKYSGRSHRDAPGSPRPRVSFAGNHCAASGTPPALQTRWVGERLENEFARRVEHACDDKHTIGWFSDDDITSCGHASSPLLVRRVCPSLEARADTRRAGQNSLPRNDDIPRASPPPLSAARRRAGRAAV